MYVVKPSNDIPHDGKPRTAFIYIRYLILEYLCQFSPLYTLLNVRMMLTAVPLTR